MTVGGQVPGAGETVAARPPLSWGPSIDTLSADAQAAGRVPPLDAEFWTVKLLAATVGEGAADHLSGTRGLGPGTSILIAGGLLGGVLMLQLAQRRHVPAVYWLVVVLISVVGQLSIDELVHVHGVGPCVCALGCSAALATTFAAWFAVEGTLSIRAVDTPRHEAFCWLAVLLAFALGDAGGELLDALAGPAHLAVAAVSAALLALVALAHTRLGLGPSAAFWLAYVLTHPLGAALGHVVSRRPEEGGLGLGPRLTSALFLAGIVATVAWMTLRWRADQDGTLRGPPR